ncbi:MAG TPA: hypothetical protein VGL77_13030 [Armatimonadota bacterium]|jgi:hypothetical protein
MNRPLEDSCEPTGEELQRIAIQHLREQSRAAHYDGDGALVNHLCAIALTNTQRWIEQNVCHLSLHDLYWAIVFPLYWLTDQFMLRTATDVFNTIAKRENENDLTQAVTQTIFLIEDCLEKREDVVQVLNSVKLSWLTDASVCEDTVLLTFTIELLWYRDPTGDSWQSIAKHWQKELSTRSASLGGELQRTRQRLALQNGLVILGVPASRDSDLDAYFSRPVEKRLYAAWNALLQCNWEALEKHIREIVGTVSFEDPVALCIADLHNVFRFHIHYRENGGKKDFGDSEIISLTRRWVHTINRKVEIFSELRENKLRSLSAQVSKKRANGSLHNDHIHCFRLVMLCKVNALRVWDALTWIEASR